MRVFKRLALRRNKILKEGKTPESVCSISTIESLRLARKAPVCETFHEDFVFNMGSSDQALAEAIDSRLFIVARNRYLVPKERRIERLPSGYSVRETRDDSQGNYWFVVTSFEVM